MLWCDALVVHSLGTINLEVPAHVFVRCPSDIEVSGLFTSTGWVS